MEILKLCLIECHYDLLFLMWPGHAQVWKVLLETSMIKMFLKKTFHLKSWMGTKHLLKQMSGLSRVKVTI